MNHEQLNREYWGRVFDMCESYNKEHGTDIKPWQCVRHDNKQWPIEYHPPFELRHPDFPKEKFSFAIAILEGNPVFVGDEIYAVDGRTFIVKHEVGRGNFAEVKNDVLWRRLDNGEDYFSWTKPQPKRTFMLNGVELPCPEKSETHCIMDHNGMKFYFKSLSDIDKWQNSYADNLTAARDKA